MAKEKKNKRGSSKSNMEYNVTTLSRKLWTVAGFHNLVEGICLVIMLSTYIELVGVQNIELLLQVYLTRMGRYVMTVIVNYFVIIVLVFVKHLNLGQQALLYVLLFQVVIYYKIQFILHQYSYCYLISIVIVT